MNARQRLSTCNEPRARGDLLWVERLKGGEEGKYVVTGHRVYGFYTHWTGQRTVPCWENHDLCEGGHSENTLRENYFLQCWSLKKNKGVFLYFTPEARNQFFAQVEGSKSFQGVTLIVKRTGAKNGRLNVELSQYDQPKLIRTKELDPYLSVLTFLKVPRQLIEAARSLGTIPDVEILAG
jgi:hypothetical protein